MKDRPILFSGAMVRANLAGSKTQTRRIVKPQPDSVKDFGRLIPYRLAAPPPEMPSAACEWPIPCPYGVPGDLLVVREAFRLAGEFDDVKPTLARPNTPVWYDATTDRIRPEGWGKTRVSIHMPRWASRLTLEITDVRVERLQDISEADAIAEGLEVFNFTGWGDEPGVPHMPEPDCYRGFPEAHWEEHAPSAYFALWDHINGKGAATFNPWVWVVAYEPHRLNVDDFRKQKGETDDEPVDDQDRPDPV